MKQFSNYILVTLTFFAFLTILAPRVVSADTPAPAPERVCQEVPLPNLPGLAADPCSSPAAYIQYWFYFALYLAGIAALLMLVAGGVMYMLSSTIPGAGKGTKYITNASLGFILLFGSYLLLRTLGGEQFITLKNPQLPSLPSCAIDFSPIPATAGDEVKMSWTINKHGATENATDTTITCANSDYVSHDARLPLIGNTTMITQKEGSLSCAFNIHDDKGTSLHECTATMPVLPEVKISSCALTKNDRFFSWKPIFDIKQWEGTFTCKSDDLIDCSNSPCSVLNEHTGNNITLLHVPPNGTCALEAKKKTGTKKLVSCSTAWGNAPSLPILPIYTITFSPSPVIVGKETEINWTINPNGADAVKTDIACTNPTLNLLSQPLTGKQKLTPAAQGKINCTFTVKNAANVPITPYVAETNVEPIPASTSCTLRHAPKIISWTPDFDFKNPDFSKRKWTGNLTCKEEIIKCPQSPIKVCDLNTQTWAGADLVNDATGSCTLTMKNKELNDSASCSLSW